MNKKSIIIATIVFLGLVLAFTCMSIREFLGVESIPFISDMKLLMDYDIPLKYIYSNGALDSNTRCNYFPFAYLIFHIIPLKNINAFLIVAILSISIIFICIYDLIKKDKNLFSIIILIIVLQFPMCFELQKGNIELVMFLFCFLFYYFYKKEKYNLSALFLACAISMKLYPALFVFLLLKKKKYKKFVLCGLYTIIITIISYFIMKEYVGRY